jgi:hypothetical protein
MTTAKSTWIRARAIAPDLAIVSAVALALLAGVIVFVFAG